MPLYFDKEVAASKLALSYCLFLVLGCFQKAVLIIQDTFPALTVWLESHMQFLLIKIIKQLFSVLSV